MADNLEDATIDLVVQGFPANKLAPLTKDTPFKRAFGSEGCEEQLRDLLNAMLCNPAESEVDVAQILNVERKDATYRNVVYVSSFPQLISRDCTTI